MEIKTHDILEQKLCKEIELIENKYQTNSGEMSIQDVEKLDKIYHTLKSMATYNAMKEAEEYGEGDMSGTRMTYSGRRGRGSDGRYVSRDAGDGYVDGYDRGYSGHYPMAYYPPRW